MIIGKIVELEIAEDMETKNVISPEKKNYITFLFLIASHASPSRHLAVANWSGGQQTSERNEQLIRVCSDPLHMNLPATKVPLVFAVILTPVVAPTKRRMNEEQNNNNYYYIS